MEKRMSSGQQRKKSHKMPVATAQLPLAHVVSLALQRAHEGQTAPVQRICQRMRKHKDVVGNWWRGKFAPRGDDLITLMSEYDEVFEAVMQMTGRDIKTETQRAALKALLDTLEGEG